MSLINLSLKDQYDAIVKSSGIAGAVGTRMLLKKGWKLITKKEPPQNPASPQVNWTEALLWGAVTGLTIGVVRVVFRRLSSEMWEKYKGLEPMEE